MESDLDQLSLFFPIMLVEKFLTRSIRVKTENWKSGVVLVVNQSFENTIENAPHYNVYRFLQLVGKTKSAQISTHSWGLTDRLRIFFFNLAFFETSNQIDFQMDN